MNIIIKETSLEEALKVFPKIKEFDRPEYATKEFCSNKIGNAKHIILAAYINDSIAGYLIGYDKNNDHSFYCWLAGVDNNYRRLGILSQMMQQFEDFAIKEGYQKITIKTVNDKRAMLSYLVKNNWNFTSVITKDKVSLNEITLEKTI